MDTNLQVERSARYGCLALLPKAGGLEPPFDPHSGFPIPWFTPAKVSFGKEYSLIAMLVSKPKSFIQPKRRCDPELAAEATKKGNVTASGTVVKVQLDQSSGKERSTWYTRACQNSRNFDKPLQASFHENLPLIRERAARYSMIAMLTTHGARAQEIRSITSLPAQLPSRKFRTDTPSNESG